MHCIVRVEKLGRELHRISLDLIIKVCCRDLASVGGIVGWTTQIIETHSQNHTKHGNWTDLATPGLIEVKCDVNVASSCGAPLLCLATTPIAHLGVTFAGWTPG
jgi:hypothetical protein